MSGYIFDGGPEGYSGCGMSLGLLLSSFSISESFGCGPSTDKGGLEIGGLEIGGSTGGLWITGGFGVTGFA